MSDIADRLRAAHWRGQAITSGNATIYGDAANEIEDLRAEVASLKEDLGLVRIVVGQKQAQIEAADAHIADLTQQLAAANGRVERLTDALDGVVPSCEHGDCQNRAVYVKLDHDGEYFSCAEHMGDGYYLDESLVHAHAALSALPYEVPSFDERSSEADKEKS